MPEIYSLEHPYFQSEIPGKRSASFMHQIIFGNGVDESFPHKVVIPMIHESQWNHMDSAWNNKREKKFYNDFVKLGEFLRKYMIGDTFITTNKVGYAASARDENGWRELHHDKYYQKNENGKLIRLPVECNIKFITIQFREELDKTQFILLNSGEIPFMDQLETDLIIKSKDRNSWRDEGKKIICPVCRVKYDDNTTKQEEDLTGT